MRNPWKVSTLVLAAVLGAVGAGMIRDAYADPQPNMKAALASLEAAKASLEKATADKGGHRVKAIGHVKDAISETQKGIDADNKK